MIERHPNLAVVVDHGGKPPIAAGGWQPWADLVAQIARHANVHCKLSGLATEARTDWTPETLRPWVEHLLACFGPARLMWGSDWPVVNLAGGYARWLAASDLLLGELAAPDRAAIFGANARRFYGLLSGLNRRVGRQYACRRSLARWTIVVAISSIDFAVVSSIGMPSRASRSSHSRTS